MLIKTLPVGMIEANCYVVTNEDTLACVVIDPGDESNTILDYLESNHLRCEAILLTHGHYDHVGAVLQVMEETGAPVYICPRDDARFTGERHYSFPMPEDGRYFDEGDVLNFAGMDFRILATPGHSPGSVCIICGDAIFTGDTLFAHGYGRTDFPGGDMSKLIESLRKLLEMDGDITVYSCHGEAATIAQIRRGYYR